MGIDSVTKKIILVSFISLFLELLVIRLVSTEIRIFAYLSNLVLLAIFVGLGLGMIVKQKISLIISALLLFLIVIFTSAFYIVRWPNLEFRLFSGITELLAPLSEAYIWQQIYTFSKTGILIGFILTISLFLVIVVTFMPFGQMLGDLLRRHKQPIVAYSANVVASIAGLWAFQLFSIARFTPYFGIVLVIGSLFFFLRENYQKFTLLVIFIVTIAYIVPKVEQEKITYWSPYQKLSISLIDRDLSNPNPQPAGRYLEVNNVGYMSLSDLSNKYHATAEAELKKLYGDDLPINLAFSDQYLLPFKFKPSPRSVLIIGAGAGNDAAGAIRAGAIVIDAVEIDPTIVEIGRKFHPEKPYSQSNVNIIVDDGRSFFQKTNKKYDLVIMSLADSHTVSSSLTNLRLDHYLYTKESFQAVRNLLTDDGILFMSFEVTRPWIGSRLTKSISEAFGQPPTIFDVRSQGVFGWGGVVFVVSKDPEYLAALTRQDRDLTDFIGANSRSYSSDINELSDNWPYLYLDKPRIPIIHVLLAAILAGSLFALRRKIFNQGSLNLPMFFWGAAFLLFEFQNISKTSLLFGLTWVTNLFTISAILGLILFSNWTAQKRLISPRTAFIFLMFSLGVQILVNIDIFNNLATWQKIIGASLFLNLPVYFGGIIFINMFSAAKNKAQALGANFLGSVFGGFAEMISFAFGIHAALFLVVLLYACGFLLSRWGFSPLAKSLNARSI